MNDAYAHTVKLDVSGTKCPVPLLRTKSMLKDLNTGDILELISTDPQTYNDIIRFCDRGKYKVLDFVKTEMQYVFYIKKC